MYVHLNEIVKTHKPIQYKLKTHIAGIGGLNKRLNALLKMSYKVYPRTSLFIKKNTWQSDKVKVTASTVSEWVRKEVFTQKNLGINSFRSSFTTYYLFKLNNKSRFIMAQRMRTSADKLYRSYNKIHTSPEDLVQVKIEPGMDLLARASVGTDESNAYVIKDNDNRVVVKRERDSEYEELHGITRAIPVIAPTSAQNKQNDIRVSNPVNVHVRKRERFKKWYSNSDNKKKHNERVNEYSRSPRVYAMRIIRELNNKKIKFENLNKSTIEKYKIEIKDGVYQSGVL